MWESLATAPIPRWWDEGKFGIFIHWGPYSVAGYKDQNRGYAEAITSDLYNKPDRYVDFMTKKFGAEQAYKYINGVLDKAARKLRAVEYPQGKGGSGSLQC